MSLPFDGLKVLEYSSFIAGPYCAKLLADMGALVTKVEMPGQGDPARSYGPFPGDIPDREKSGLFFFLGTNKRSVTLDPASLTGRELFLRLASNTDVLVEDSGPAAMQELGLDYQSLKTINPGLVYVSITPYGQDGPKAHWKASHINSFHASGEGYTLPGGVSHALFPERGPVAAGVHLGEYDSGLLAASGAVAALYARELQGCGQLVDISKQEATLAMNRLGLAQFTGQGRHLDRSRHYEYGGIYPCQDGYILLYPREDHQWQALATIMGGPQLAEDERFHTRAQRIENGPEVNRIIGEWSANFTKQDIYDRVAPSGCPTGYFATAQDLVESPQAQAREFFRQVDHPKAGAFQVPGPPYKMSGASQLPLAPAPLLGQHNDEVFCGELGVDQEELPGLRRAGVI